VVTSAPGRLNLLGEHTDYNGGPVLPCALERRTVVAAGHGDGWEAISTLDLSMRVIDPDAVRPGDWTDYIGGVIRVLRRRGLAPRGARLAIASNLPIGAGLASSAALLVAATRALVVLAGRRLRPELLADIAYEAEHDEVGVHCGRMDQTVAALARAGQAMLFEPGEGAITHIPLPGRIWVFETGVLHRLVAGNLNERRQECEVALRMVRDLGSRVTHLAEVAPEGLPELLRGMPAPWASRLRHVITEVARTRAAAHALAARDLPRLGGLIAEGHESLRRDFQSSCPEADLLVEAALGRGAYGARLTGAGWGGAVVGLLPEEGVARVVAEIQEEFRQAFGRAPVIWATRAAAGARSEK
jgi:galactokinase